LQEIMLKGEKDPSIVIEMKDFENYLKNLFRAGMSTLQTI